MILCRYEHLAFNYKYKYLQESLIVYMSAGDGAGARRFSTGVSEEGANGHPDIHTV